jgi:acyl-CoA synthetase (AMP-forming)/AMP-acid ligase II
MFRGPNVMKGYLNNDAATNEIMENGWICTGDLGYIDQDQFVFISGRLKELIKVKGFQVAPAELETVLLKHPGVADCAVVGIANDNAGEVPKALVVRQQGYGNLQTEDLQRHMRNSLSSYKVIHSADFVTEIPKNASGKILRRIIQDSIKSKL